MPLLCRIVPADRHPAARRRRVPEPSCLPKNERNHPTRAPPYDRQPLLDRADPPIGRRRHDRRPSMRVVYIHSATADLTEGDAAAIADARIVQDTSVDRAGLSTLLALLADGDDLLVPDLGHLGATARAALASLRRASEAGVRVFVLRGGVSGESSPRPRDSGKRRRDPRSVRGRRRGSEDRCDRRAVGRHGHARPPRPSGCARAPAHRQPRRVPGQCRLMPFPEARP
ncbi:hypothetical protein FBY14_107182 [Azospirillum brasilense]|nr:hypothetical protein FBY14_107182 [Azospirillum brasilense]